MTLSGKALSLSGPASFNGASVVGSNTLTTGGATSVGSSGLTVGGAVTWQNNGVVTASGGLVLGDSAANKAVLINGSGGVYNFTGNVGIALGGRSTTTLQNAGLLEKTSGTGTSHIGVVVTDTGTVTVATGMLEFDGTTASFSGTLGGAGTLGFGGGGHNTLNAGTSLTVANVLLTGGAYLTAATDVSYGGVLTQKSGTTLVANSGSTLSLGGSTTLQGTVTGAGTLAFTGGSVTLGSGIALHNGSWTIASGVTVAEHASISFSGGFTDGASALTLGSSTLTLGGSASFAGSTVDGPGRLFTKGATSVAGLTLGGAAAWQSYGTVTQSGTVTIGDASGSTATIKNETGATYDITADGGVGLASGASGSVTNLGLLEKTGGAGVSVIGLSVVNSSAVTAASGTLDLTGTVSGTGTLNVQSGATLQLDGSVSSTQTVAFGSGGGDLALTNTDGFKAKLSGFGSGDAIDLTQFAFSGSETLSFAESAGNTQGVLTITDGALHAAITLFGQYAAAGFTLASDGAAGTTITYAPPPGPHDLAQIATHH